jgi:hypothetical protein
MVYPINLAGVLFDILFNLHKFMRFEARDPFQEKIRREDAFQSDWDRYAHIEYNRLAQEEEDGNSYAVRDRDMHYSFPLSMDDPCPPPIY